MTDDWIFCIIREGDFFRLGCSSGCPAMGFATLSRGYTVSMLGFVDLIWDIQAFRLNLPYSCAQAFFMFKLCKVAPSGTEHMNCFADLVGS